MRSELVNTTGWSLGGREAASPEHGDEDGTAPALWDAISKQYSS